jgi:hypothetical protein
LWEYWAIVEDVLVPESFPCIEYLLLVHSIYGEGMSEDSFCEALFTESFVHLLAFEIHNDRVEDKLGERHD